MGAGACNPEAVRDIEGVGPRRVLPLKRLCLLLAVVCSAARADLLSHALVRYGDPTFTVDEHFGTQTADAALLYSNPGSFHGVSSAQAAYGHLEAAATVLAVDAAYPVNFAQAEAGFTDSLTINGPSGVGFVVYTYAVEGWAVGEQSLGAMFLRHGGEPDEELSDEIAGGETFQSLPHAVSFGQPFTHGLILQANGGIGLGETGEFGSVLSAMLTGIEVFDASMNPVGTYTVSSSSGTSYPLPEPGAALLLLAALAIGPRRRR